jgi:Zn-dependent protease with chaperone function
VIARWPLAEVRRVEAGEGVLRLTEGEGRPARLDVRADAAGAEALAGIPFVRDRVAGAGATFRVVAWSAAAGVSLILSALYLVPALADRAAALVPLRLEQRLGQTVDAQVKRIFGSNTCSDPAGVEALAVLVRKLSAAGKLSGEPDVTVLFTPVPNAIALPGGRIYLFHGLLRRASSVDEVAGVIGHEMGHVAHRDGLRSLLRAGGTSFLIGLLFGDVTGAGVGIAVAQVAIEGASSREMEREADRFARDVTRGLGRPSKPMGELLSRLGGDDVVPVFLRSHPVTAERLAFLADGSQETGEALLTDAQWLALKDICRSAPSGT